ncbi:receptor-interacting serine/threonine-protein kinase 4 isoform X2 [Hoplias malabaricus]|uniref:receptor-interacting serine/threonine-protein kinase 4 isoform X2 n=1 Tax=Hoplias malabaricus TaxID=27720 RepID=UPI003461E591
MELSSCVLPTSIGSDSLESWHRIGSGGFGQIYKAKHKTWGMNVAIKLLRFNDGSGSSLLREADLMRHGGSTYVLRILGVYEGHTPMKNSTQFGLVMEYMERGSLADLQIILNGPPPWSLAFRITHQITLGMNFLHQLKPPLLHLDLKPSNVLLDDSLNAKLTDFGLAKVAQSASRMIKGECEELAGTTSYMPPEAFQCSSYTPSFSSDIYSYGILLWSLITGREPYNVVSSLVRFRIPEGDRPDLSSVDTRKASGLSELKKLMEHCWHADPKQRPSFMDCVKVTETVFEQHKKKVYDDVRVILNKLDDNDNCCSSMHSFHINSNTSNGHHRGYSYQSVNSHQPVQDTGGDAFSKPQVLPGAKAKPADKVPPINQKPSFPQRQFSIPGSVNFHLTNVTGMQIGNGNTMNINFSAKKKRQRHPTAPPQLSTQNTYQPSEEQQNPHHKS